MDNSKVECLVVEMVDWMVECLVVEMVELKVVEMVGWMVEFLVDLMVDWMVECSVAVKVQVGKNLQLPLLCILMLSFHLLIDHCYKNPNNTSILLTSMHMYVHYLQ
jgi:hypothetical protein